MLHSARQGNDILVSLANAGVQRNGRWLVRGVEFSVSKGEIVTLIGPTAREIHQRKNRRSVW